MKWENQTGEVIYLEDEDGIKVSVVVPAGSFTHQFGGGQKELAKKFILNILDMERRLVEYSLTSCWDEGEEEELIWKTRNLIKLTKDIEDEL